LAAIYPEFGKMSAKSIHGSRALANEKVAGSVNHQHALLLFCFERHKAHSRSLNSSIPPRPRHHVCWL
jgi:hypothetical protein